MDRERAQQSTWFGIGYPSVQLKIRTSQEYPHLGEPLDQKEKYYEFG
jgi:hypothetical protein